MKIKKETFYKIYNKLIEFNKPNNKKINEVKREKTIEVTIEEFVKNIHRIYNKLKRKPSTLVGGVL